MDGKINEFARRCFRDSADQEYISARMCWQASLHAQFRWQALHALEKYLKGILLFHRIESKLPDEKGKMRFIGHEPGRLLEKASELPFKIDLSAKSREFIRRLDQSAADRYLEFSFYISGPALLDLDRVVWEVRRYCQSLDYQKSIQSKVVDFLPSNIEQINKSVKAAPQAFRIMGGLLEKIIDDRNHPARPHLVYQNGFFGSSRRRSIKVKDITMSSNSPSYLYPDVLEEVSRYVRISKGVLAAAKKQLESENKNN